MSTKTPQAQYTDRRSRIAFLWSRYGSLLQESSILDVGADRCHLRGYLGPGSRYASVGFGEDCDLELDLESGELPYETNSFDCVVCLDVLEHLENLHRVFDECCRVSSRHFILSLPNAWAALYGAFRQRGPLPLQPLKYYGLPVDPPPDRHRWFFGLSESRRFVEQRAPRNGMRVKEAYPIGPWSEPTLLGRWRGAILRRLLWGSSPERTELFSLGLWVWLVK